MQNMPHARGLARAPARLTAGWRTVTVVLLALLGSASVGAQEALRWDGGRTRGNPDAPVVLIEFSDFTCGYCKKFFLETWPRLKANYVDTGRLLFVYRDYPRADRGPGLDAAIAARCAGEQGSYWAMHDRLLSGKSPLVGEAFDLHASAIGLDMAAFRQCRRRADDVTEVYREKAQAHQLGFRGTPGFVLLRADGGRRSAGEVPLIGIPGAVPYEVFEEEIERLLAMGAS